MKKCKPLKAYKFPVSNEYGKTRSFNKSWFDEYCWSAYSTSQDGTYCKVCSLFCDSPKADKLVRSPLTFRTTATQIKKHEKSEMHKNASLLADGFVKVMKSKQKRQLNAAVALQVNQNREKLHSIIETILFCGRLNIPLRGHRESDASNNNPGNFKELLTFRVNSGDHILKDHLETAPRNATYTSNRVVVKQETKLNGKGLIVHKLQSVRSI